MFFCYFYFINFGHCCVADRKHNVEVTMDPDHHHPAIVPRDQVSDGKPVNVDSASVDDSAIYKPAARNIAATNEIETNGKCPEQLEMMIVKDGVAPVRDAREFAEVLSLGCNCRERSTLRGVIVMVIMLLSNMLNYMDRFTIVGMFC